MNKKIKKNWKKYFLEFLMLFLAVFLGFLADNLLVNITHNRQEKDYIKSLIVDVRSDKLAIKESIELNQLKIKQFDSLSKLCFTYRQGENVKDIYQYYMLVLGEYSIVKPSNRTISQLKSTGAMRLIKNQQSINTIMDYERQKETLIFQGKLYLNNLQKLIDLGLNIFNFSNFYTLLYKSSDKHDTNLDEFKLIKDDKATIIKLGNISTISKSTLKSYVYLLKKTNKKADSLINTLRTNYNLKKNRH